MPPSQTTPPRLSAEPIATEEKALCKKKARDPEALRTKKARKSKLVATPAVEGAPVAEEKALEAKLRELAEMRDTLARLVHCCAGDNRPDCPILEDLAKTHI